MSEATEQQSEAKNPSLAIVGGGISGLSAAYYALKKGKAGADIHIYEGTERAGGQIRSGYLQGRVVNKGAEFIDSDQASIIAMCRELGVPLKASDDQGTLRFRLPNGKVMEEKEFLAAYQPISEQIIAHKAQLANNPHGALAQRLNAMTLDQYLDELGTVPRNPHRNFFQALWDTVTFSDNRVDPNVVAMAKQSYSSEAGNAPATINALQFVNEASGTADAILASDCAYRVEGGTEKLIEALQNKLESQGVQFHKNSPVEAVQKLADGKIRLSVAGAQARDVVADNAILALPAYALGKVKGLETLGFSPEAQQVIAQTQYTNSIKFTVALKDGVTADNANFFSSKGYQVWSSDPTQMTFLVNADDLTAGKTNTKAFVESCLADYAQAHGKPVSALFKPMSAENIVLTNPGKSPCYASPGKGQLLALEKLGGAMDQLAENGVGIAGTFIPHRGEDGIGIGFMECGLHSAEHAANRLLTPAVARERWVDKLQLQKAPVIQTVAGAHRPAANDGVMPRAMAR